jgi:excisionase family DNA binding protein
VILQLIGQVTSLTTELVTADQAAKYLGVTKRNVNALIERGTLPAKRVGRVNLIVMRDLRHYARTKMRKREASVFARGV